MIYSVTLSGPITHRIHLLIREGQINRTSVRELIRKHRLIFYCLVAWFAIKLWVYATLNLIKKCLVATGWREITVPTWCDPIIKCKVHTSQEGFFFLLSYLGLYTYLYMAWVFDLLQSSFFFIVEMQKKKKKDPIQKFQYKWLLISRTVS